MSTAERTAAPAVDTVSAGYFERVAASPYLWGTAVTVAFYAALPYAPLEREFVTRYFCSHWIEYATTWAFFLAMAVLLQKGFRLFGEFGALKKNVIGAAQLENLSDAGRVEALIKVEKSWSRGERRTLLADRLRESCRYLSSGGQSSSLDAHLKYLADLASDATHASYQFVQTATWAIPILGFLGTVIGITMAIAEVSENTSLEKVASGLAVAFDTTALSLSLSLVVVFVTKIVERLEQQLLGRVEDFGINSFAPLFARGQEAVPASPWAAAETHASQQLLQQTESVIAWQTGLWQQALEELRSRWTTSLSDQQVHLAEALQVGTAQTLSDHATQLATSREHMLQSVHMIARELGESTRSWRDDVQQASAALTSQLAELRSQGEMLMKITENEESLVRLQETMQQNLHSLRSVETLDEAVHSLSAAVHLLTARTGSRAAA